MPGRRIGLLLDSLSENTGDKASRLVMEDFLRSESVNYETANPTKFNRRRYSRVIVGGGDLIQPPGNPFYDVFRQKGRHILNCVGINSDLELEYLRNYSYVSVRSEDDARIIQQKGMEPQIVPCVSMTLPKKPVGLQLPAGTIGFHFHSISYANVPEVQHVIKRFSDSPVAFIPFTHYNNDTSTMELIASNVPDAFFLGKYDPAELMTIVGKLRAFVCSSLHAAIFAYANNVPFLVYPYSSKIERFLKDRKLERLAFHNSNELEQRLHTILANPPDFTETYRADVAKIKNHLNQIADILQTPNRGRLTIATAPRRRAGSATPYLSHMMAQRAADLHYVEAKLAEVAEENWQLKQARTVKAGDALENLRVRLVPPGTRRKTFEEIAAASVTMMREQGFLTYAKKSAEKVGRRQFRIISMIDYTVPDREYAEWILRNEPGLGELAEQREQSKKFPYQPLISIILPVWNPPPASLAQAIDLVIEQTYPNWELCITDGGSNEQVRKVISEGEHRDGRIHVKLLDENLGISGNSNVSLEMCRGEFAVLLDHDDELAPSALFEVVKLLNEKADLDFIYTDKDSITLQGKRFAPLFKPDWSPCVMLSANYVTHMCVIRTEIIKKVGGFKPETDGAQDWDLFLRVAEATQKIHHIPKILYHWRLAPDSVSARGLDAKPYATKAQLRTLNQHLRRRNIPGEAFFNDLGYARVRWKYASRPFASVLTYSRNAPEVNQLLNSISSKTSYGNFEVIVVCSRKDTHRIRRGFPNVRTVEAHPETYAQAYNIATRDSTGEVLAFVDPGVEIVKREWLTELSGWLSQPQVGIAGPQLLSPAGNITHQGIVLGLSGFLFEGAHEGAWTQLGHVEWYRNVTAVTGACLAIRKKLFQDLGMFNSKSQAPDIDLCLKARKEHYEIVCTPEAKLILREPTRWLMELSSVNQTLRSRQVNDPYFNRNLSPHYTIPRLNVA